MQPSSRNKSLSPPRPADLTSIIHRIELRRAAQTLHAQPALASYAHHHHLNDTPRAAGSTFQTSGVQHLPAEQQQHPAGHAPSLYTSPSPPVPQPLGVAHTTEASLLRLDLEQKRHEIDVKRQTIAKLEEEHIRLLNELDALRRAEDEKRDALVRQHRADISKERSLVEELQTQLSDEVCRRGSAEREVLTLRDSKSRLEQLEDRMRTLQLLLDDREKELMSATASRQSVAAQLAELQENDKTNVLLGRVAVLEEQLAAEAAKGEALHKVLREEQQRREVMERRLAERDAEYTKTEAALAAALVDLQHVRELCTGRAAECSRQEERIKDLQSSLHDSEAASSALRVAKDQECDEARSEVRRRVQQVFQLETQVVELQEQRSALEQSIQSLHHSMDLQREEQDSLLTRLRAAHAGIEERETELSKMSTLLHEHKQQVLQYKAEVGTLANELTQQVEAVKAARIAAEVSESSLQTKTGVEELLALCRQTNATLESDLAAEQSVSAKLRERVAQAEQHITALTHTVEAVGDVERRLAQREAELTAAAADRRVLEVREQAAIDDVRSLRERLHIADTRFVVECERREELERKVRLMEDSARDTFSVYGKYLALQQYLTTATSETAKAAQLNSALLEEVRVLEARNRQLEEQVHTHTLVKERSEQLAAANEELRVELDRVRRRALDAETRAAELLKSSHSEGMHRNRIHELESMLVDAVARGAETVSVARSLPQARGSPPRSPSLRAVQSSSPQLATQSPPRPLHDSLAQAQHGDIPPVASQERVAVAESYRDTAVSPVSSEGAEAGSTPEPKAEGAQSSVPTSPADEAAREVVALRRQLELQDVRMEQLSLQFAAALTELHRVKTPTKVQADVLPQTPPRRAASPPATAAPVLSHSKRQSPPSAPTRSAMVSPLALAQSQQRERSKRNTGTRLDDRITSSTQRSSSYLARPTSGLSSPLRDTNRSASLPVAGTPPRAPSPKSAILQQQRASLNDHVRQQMAKLFRNAQVVAFPPSPLQGGSPRHMMGVMSPSRDAGL